MKRIALTVFASLFAVAAFGQGKFGPDSLECMKFLSFYQQYEKQGDLAGAAPSWRQAMKYCPPTASQNMLVDGMKILRMEINKFKSNPLRKKELVDSLMMLHQMRIDNYGSGRYLIPAVTNKAVDMMNYAEPGSEQEVFTVLGEAMDVAGNRASTTVAVRYLDYAIQLYKSGTFTSEDVMAAFEKSIATLESVEAAKPSSMVEKAIEDVESMFATSGVASCENLIAVFQPRYDATPEDKVLLSNIVNLFSSTECVDTDLFRNAVETLHRLEPSSKSAHNLYQLFGQIQGQEEKSISYLREAVSLEENTDLKAEYSYELASFLFAKMDRKAEAVAAAKQAASLSGTWAGKAYYLIGTVWSVCKVAGNDIESRSPFWVATDYMYKAKNADPSLASDVEAQLKVYRQYYPMQSDAFMYNIVDGDEYTVTSNGMTEKTVVRTQK